jgi:hypothetical protein
VRDEKEQDEIERRDAEEQRGETQFTMGCVGVHCKSIYRIGRIWWWAIWKMKSRKEWKMILKNIGPVGVSTESIIYTPFSFVEKWGGGSAIFMGPAEDISKGRRGGSAAFSCVDYRVCQLKKKKMRREINGIFNETMAKSFHIAVRGEKTQITEALLCKTEKKKKYSTKLFERGAQVNLMYAKPMLFY